MKLEYQNGVRVSLLVHEQSLFERMLDRYTEQAKKHYAKTKKTNLTKEERDKELKNSLAFLAHERRHLNTIAGVQAELDAYRKTGNSVNQGTKSERSASLAYLMAENHHPTEVLEKYMRAEGIPKPSSKHTAHHIVPGQGKLPAITNRIRVHIHMHGIRINDPANGVYLLHKDEDTPHWSMPKSRGHLKYHTHDYERWIAQKIGALNNIDLIKTQLQIIGRILQYNEPKNVIPKSTLR